MDEITDQQIVEIATIIDDFYASLIQNNDVHVTDITAMVVARALLINDVAGYGDEFRDMLKRVGKLAPKKPKSEFMH